MLHRLKSLFRAPPEMLLVAGGLYMIAGVIFCVIGIAAGTLCVAAALSPLTFGPCAVVPAHTVMLHFAHSVPLLALRLLFWPYWVLGFSDMPFMEWLITPWLSAPGAIAAEGDLLDLVTVAAIGGFCFFICLKCLRGMLHTTIHSARFWHIAMKDPDAVYDFVLSSPDWHVFREKPPGGFGAHLPPGEWDGPFNLSSKTGRPVIHAFGRTPGYEGSQQDFVARYRAANKKAP
jgi:hypothetical protein